MTRSAARMFEPYSSASNFGIYGMFTRSLGRPQQSCSRNAQLGQILADGGRVADQRVARDRQIRTHRLGGLSAAVRARLFARCRLRLLPLARGDIFREL